MEAEQTVEQPHSVEISINAKGQYSGKVKVYAVTPEEALEHALKKAEQLEKVIQDKNGGNEK